MGYTCLLKPNIRKMESLSPRWIPDLCVEGRIPGAVKIGSYWAIPEDAKAKRRQDKNR